MRSWIRHTEIDYADVLLFTAAGITTAPAVYLIGYGFYSTVTNGARLIASIF